MEVRLRRKECVAARKSGTLDILRMVRQWKVKDSERLSWGVVGQNYAVWQDSVTLIQGSWGVMEDFIQGVARSDLF